MATHVVWDHSKGNQVVGVFRTAGEATAAAAGAASWTAGQIADSDDVDVGWYVDVSKTPHTAAAEVPAAQQTASDRDDWYARISAAFLAGVELLNRAAFYRTRIGLATAQNFNAAFGWLYHTSALAKLTVDGAVFASLAAGARTTLLEHLEFEMASQADSAFAGFVADATRSAAWAGLSCADGAAVNTDLATSAGAPRNRDGSNTAVAGATIPAKFTPEHPALQ